MPFAKFSNLDFDQIRTQIKDYLRANSNFTDFDFEGSNFSVLIDTLAYNTYITAFNSNMVVNESFLDSATLRENVVSLARNIGYVPRSRSAAKAQVRLSITTTYNTTTLTLGAGQSVLGMQQDGQSVIWTGTVDLTDNGRIDTREGDWVGFFLTGYDSAGNEFPLVEENGQLISYWAIELPQQSWTAEEQRRHDEYIAHSVLDEAQAGPGRPEASG